MPANPRELFRLAAANPTHNIACNTLTYVFAEMGLPPPVGQIAAQLDRELRRRFAHWSIRGDNVRRPQHDRGGATMGRAAAGAAAGATGVGAATVSAAALAGTQVAASSPGSSSRPTLGQVASMAGGTARNMGSRHRTGRIARSGCKPLTCLRNSGLPRQSWLLSQMNSTLSGPKQT